MRPQQKKRGPLSGKGKPSDPFEPFRKALVHVRYTSGTVEKVNALRAARLVFVQKLATPHEWTREQAAVVIAAQDARERRQVDTLKRDGLLVGEENAEPLVTGPLAEVGRWWRGW